MLGRETKLGARLECMAVLSGRAGTTSEVDFSREIRLFPKFCLSEKQLATRTMKRTKAGRSENAGGPQIENRGHSNTVVRPNHVSCYFNRLAME